MLRFVVSGLIIAMIAAGLTSQVAVSQTPIDPDVPPDYAGVCLDGSIISIASVQMGTAPQAFYSMYGRWPDSWWEVRSAGLVQVDLYAATGEYIDPDDGSLDFKRDRIYIAPRFPGEPAQQIVKLNGDPIAYDYFVPLTYDEIFTNYIPGEGGLLGNTQRYQQFAMANVINSGIMAFQMVHARFPEDFDEFLGSGIGNIDFNSINPLTGDRYYGDGRPNDFRYEIRNETYAIVNPTDENGDTPWNFSM